VPEAAPVRYRVTFAKTEAMRFTGHLDLHRTWERTFRRAGLPLAYSEGFHPHPRLNIGAALPLGCLSRGDLIDAWLEREAEPEEVEAALRLAVPPGIDIERVARVETAEPVLQTRIASSSYEVTAATWPPPEELQQRITTLLDTAHLWRVRRGKSYDLRPRIQRLNFVPARAILEMQLSAREGTVGRPDEVLDALGLDPANCVAVRTGLVLAEQMK
jgi:radical SAM-linked protein